MTLHLPADATEKAIVIAKLAEHTDTATLADMLAPWVREAPGDMLRVLLTLAAMADKDKFLKQAHAAYTRGVRTPAVVEMEREYQRLKKRKYHAVRRARAEDQGAA